MWRRGGPMISLLVSGLRGPGSSPPRGHCLVFLGKTLINHSAVLHSHAQMVPVNLTLGVTLRWTSISHREEQRY